MKQKPITYQCRACQRPHSRRNLAVECCSPNEVLSTVELEEIGQGRLFDEQNAAPVVAAVSPTGQRNVF